jgi:small subunit ribosomal protein S20
MPVTKSAQKKLRQDKKRKSSNATVKAAYKSAVKKVTKSTAKKAMSAIDKAVKKKVMHKNKAARLKSRVSKLTR